VTSERELWEGKALPYLPGRNAYRTKQRTKREVVAEFRRKEKNMSPEIGTEVREGADNVRENVAYEITLVEIDVVTDVKSYDGVRVELLSVKGHVGNVMLWKRPVTGKDSKLGKFITLLGSNTDKWLHKWVIFRGWEKGNRNIELVPAPVEAVSKAKTGKGVVAAVKKAQGKK